MRERCSLSKDIFEAMCESHQVREHEPALIYSITESDQAVPDELQDDAQWARMQPKCAKSNFPNFWILIFFCKFTKVNTLVYICVQYFPLK